MENKYIEEDFLNIDLFLKNDREIRYNKRRIIMLVGGLTITIGSIVTYLYTRETKTKVLKQ